jgi:hypothetical protein
VFVFVVAPSQLPSSAQTVATDSLAAATPSPSIPLTAVAQEIERQGYHSISGAVVTPNAWENSTFRMRNKRIFSFRANKPFANTRDFYCRFQFFEESYNSADDARHRLANIHLPDPSGPAEELHYLSAMRAGFRVGNVAYVLQTDAAMFWDEVERFTKELAATTPGAELIQAQPK